MNEPTICKFPKLPKTVKSYKSYRSAKMAVTKAYKAYQVAVRNGCTDEAHQGPVLGSDSWDILHGRIREYFKAAWANFEATLASARTQGFAVPNPQR